MFISCVFFVCCVGSGLCDGLIILSEDFTVHMCLSACVYVCVCVI